MGSIDERGNFLTEEGADTFANVESRSFENFDQSLGVAQGYGPTASVLVSAIGRDTRQVLQVCRDSGRSWRMVTEPDTVGDWPWRLIAFSPTDPQVIYAGRLRTMDGPESWTALPREVVAMHSRNGDVVFALGSDGEGRLTVSRSNDKGSTWPVTCPALPTTRSGVIRVAADPDRLYVAKWGEGL